MIKSVKAVGALAVILVQTMAFAHTEKRCDFAPKNNLKIPAGMELAGGLDKAAFNRVIDKVESFYRPIIEKNGVKFVMNRLWDKKDIVVHQDGSEENGDTVNANAEQDRSGKTWYVNMFGGLARHSVTTEDGFALVLCHEIGHHLGGFPKVLTAFGPRWASNEGQADYFATMKCFRRVFEKDNNSAAIAAMSIPQTMKKGCSDHFKSQNEIDLCLRESMGGQVLANLLNALRNEAAAERGLPPMKDPTVDTMDVTVVKKTDDRHPAAQCRMDTYFAGSICPISYTEEFGKADAGTGACAMEKGDKFGFRPLCWYKPQ